MHCLSWPFPAGLNCRPAGLDLSVLFIPDSSQDEPNYPNICFLWLRCVSSSSFVFFLGNILGRSCRHLGDILGKSCRHLGDILGEFFLDILRIFWRYLGNILHISWGQHRDFLRILSWFFQWVFFIIIIIIMAYQHNPTSHIPTRWGSVIIMSNGNLTQSISHHTYI